MSGDISLSAVGVGAIGALIAVMIKFIAVPIRDEGFRPYVRKYFASRGDKKKVKWVEFRCTRYEKKASNDQNENKASNDQNENEASNDQFLHQHRLIVSSEEAKQFTNNERKLPKCPIDRYDFYNEPVDLNDGIDNSAKAVTPQNKQATTLRV